MSWFRSKNKFVPDKNRKFICPFYGFQKVPFALLDGEGNGCGLLEHQLSPCRYDLHGGPVPITQCSCFENEDIAREFIAAGKKSKIRVFPHEIKEGKGLSFKNWMRYF